MNKEKKQGLIAILCANTIFGLNIPVTKSIVENWMSPIGYTTTRMLFGAFVFWIVSLFQEQERVERKDLIIIFFGGMTGFLGTQFLFSLSLQYTTPVIFSLLMSMTPVIVLLLSAVFLKELIPFRKLAGIIISISGASLIILLRNTQEQHLENNFLGIVFSFLCVLCYAIYLILTRKISVKYKPITIAKWMFLFSTIVVLPVSFSDLQHQKMFTTATTDSVISLLTFSLIFSTLLAFF